MVKHFIVLTLVTAFIISGCGNFQGVQPNDPNNDTVDRFDALTTPENIAPDQVSEGEQTTNPVSVLINHTEAEEVSTFIEKEETYFPLVRVLEILGFNVLENDDGDTIQAGYTDVIYEVKKESDQAIVEGEALELPSPVSLFDTEAYISITSLQELLGNSFGVELANGSLIINTIETPEDYGFPENEDLGEAEINEEVEDVPAVTSAQADRIIRTARKLIGTPYVFGAPSGDTKRMDCSSFTQYVYGVHGFDLPRTARSQARLGKYVPVSQLRKGDLVFFAWPGRFQSDRIVGHVGIYMGNGYVIHTTPNRGVHIVNASKSKYWKSAYLGAKRSS
jgi:cell wall-associated NlpC family hydrolase